MSKRPLTFLRAWVRNPLQTAAVAPSSRALANLITADLSPRVGRVVELGGGTGAFTQAILARGVRPQDLTVFEINPEFARHLRRTYPGVTVIEAPAEAMAEHVATGPGSIGAMVSGLPFINIPQRGQRLILDQAFRLLGPDGFFAQFTYGPVAPVRGALLADLGLSAQRTGFALGNLPPASVYRLSRVHSDASP